MAADGMSFDDLFINPTGTNAAQMEAIGGEFVRALVQALGTAGSRPPLAPGAVPEFPGATALPVEGVAVPELLADFQRLIVPGAMNCAHPGYLGHMDTMAGAVPIFAALLSAGLNNNPLFFEEAPSLTRLEVQLTQGFARLFGLPAGAGGTLTTAGTIANLTAMLAARNRARPAVSDDGLCGGRPLAAFVSELAHVSFEKAVATLGLGRRHLHRVRADAHHRMDAAALAAAIGAARDAGEEPFFVGATAGTTVVGSIDPLHDIADICRQEGLWFHADAAYGGTLAFAPVAGSRLAGIDRADSVTFNPQKWMYVPKACAMVLFRDVAAARALIASAAPYALPQDGRDINLGDHAVQGTRHADVLKLWMGLRAFGTRRLGALVDRQIAAGAALAARVRAEPALELLAEPEMNIVCFGVAGGRARGGEANLAAQQAVAAAGRNWVSAPLFRGARVLRALLLNPFTTQTQTDGLLADVLGAASASPGAPGVPAGSARGAPAIPARGETV